MVSIGSTPSIVGPLAQRRFWLASLALVGVAAGFGADSAGAFDPALYAVRISRADQPDPEHLPKTGNAGIYLGHGLVLTAAHVAGNPLASKPLAVVACARVVPASIAAAGTFETIDVSVLRVDPAVLPAAIRTLPPLTLCAKPPVPGQAVVVVEQGLTAKSVVIPPLPPSEGTVARFDTLIRDVYSTPNSGSGVFDAGSGCLMGIMSRKIERLIRRADGRGPTERMGLGKYFVPADQIRSVLGALP